MTKQLIMNDKGAGKYPEPVRSVLVNMMKPCNLHLIDHNTENSILSLLTQLVRDELEYKRQIGAMFIPMIGERLKEIMRYVQYKARQEAELARGKLKEVQADENLPDNIRFDEDCEKKFFKFINVLFKASDENLAKLKRQRETINDYLEGPLNSWCLQYNTDNGNANDAYWFEHYMAIREKVKNLVKIIE